MDKKVSFKVDPKLAELLGETYKSTEDAIKELVDNSFDADSDCVWVTLPEPFTPNPEIIIMDNGTGMKPVELSNEYLKIASSRLSRKGAETFQKKRKVKGRKGIGKFAGLMIADIMEVSTKANGKQTSIAILKPELAKAKYDLEKVSFPLQVRDCDKKEHGTILTLKGLNQSFSFPNPEKLKQILVWDYGRVHDFEIFVNDEKIGVQDVAGKTFQKEIQLENGKMAQVIYTITDKPVKQPGLLYRVGGKIVGRPENFLKDDEIIPEKLQKRVTGEIICDDLEDFVTADHGSIIENSLLNQDLKVEVKKEVSSSIDDVFKTEMNLAKARFKQKINRELERLPDYRRPFAEKYLQRVLEKFYGDSDDKINTVISVMVDALEKDSYWNVVKNIEEARDSDVERFANAMSEFGFLEMGIISNQAINRLRFLDELDLLKSNPNSNESTMHKALEKNLWVLGSDYSLIFSNKTLAKAIQDYLDKEFKGARASKRPDLFLGSSINRNYHLIEFKHPTKTIGRDAESQALKYRDDLNSVIHNKNINISIIGGKVDPSISSHNERADVKFLSYLEVISNGRTQLNWLLEELSSD